jgi:4-phytase/acid phosphatase
MKVKQITAKCCLVVCVLMQAGFARAQATEEHKDQPQAQEQLKFVLVLTRHGVRSPTWTNALLDEYAKQPWPKWPVEPGILTPHGKQLMTYFGAYYRAYFSRLGLLSSDGCAAASEVYLWADTNQRTSETARGLADGMFPGCPTRVHSLSETTRDELFHTTVKPSVYPRELAALAGRIGDDPAALLSAYRMPLEAMQHVLADCGQDPCNTTGNKSLLAVEPSLTPASGNHSFELKGPLITSATFAENFQLEYLEGMPADAVGWGRVDEAHMESLMLLHAASSDLIQRTPSIARAQASNLLTYILLTLSQAQQRKSVAGAIGSTSDKVVFLVGHDTNISNIAALLNAHWLIDGYQRDDAAPGGALVFELWQRAGHADSVKVYYQVQSPEQMHNTMPLTTSAPPKRAAIFLPGCSFSEEGFSCEWEEFKKLLLAQTVEPSDR